MDDEKKQLKNLFKKLINDQNSVFYSADRINTTLLNKGRRSSYEKDKVFYKLFNTIEDRNIIYEDDEKRIPFYTLFVEQKKDIDRSSSLYTINGPLQFFHADVAFLKFFAKSAVDPKYALLCVDLFTSKIYVYTMRKKSNLWQKLELFYKEIDPKRDKNNGNMRLQTDLEFQQNEIKKLNVNIMLKCLVRELVVEKLLPPNKKLENLKRYYLKAKDYIRQRKEKD